MAKGADFDQAMFVTTGRTVDELDALWQGKHKNSFLWLQTVEVAHAKLELFRITPPDGGQKKLGLFCSESKRVVAIKIYL